ncbi:acetyl esterase/lipase [Kitasatospora sp. GAS204A]|uniref:dienelactone hydrolase family protein n=1 Tax=unclassified Kitasatospora TaxID=2633591 RepID=UPI0024736D5B|nr:dienelactone hydrolase family protein [Kitasatospora sp. GAS204B]MDH6120418.1 acetyl esterase/lipase [Kitasatospora sp. GAS204B]
MTAFVLVPGPWAGDWIWQQVTARLRESGAEVFPTALTGTFAGSTDGGEAAGPGTDLETQIAALLRLIDRIAAPQLVLVGHGNGMHPVLGAADRRPERIARVVYLDAGLPQDGESVLDLVPDPAVRDRLVRQAAAVGEGWRVPAPSAEEWPLWGSLAGVPEEALAQLVERGTPQPLGTLSRPLRLSGAAAELPTTGILCTANGASVAMVETVVGMGDPRFQVLTEPRVRFIEIDTGHWPMLSAPDELAAVLLRAAAGEGQRVSAKAGGLLAEPRRFLLDVPERARERVGRVDLHLPDPACALRPWPAVVFVHGGPVPRDAPTTPRDSATFLGYGRYAASLGVVGVTVDHRLHGLGDFAQAAADVADAVELVRADPRVDGERVALWFFSGGGLLSADWLAAPPPWLRCVAATYPVLAPLPNWGLTESRFRPAVALAGAGHLPIVLTRVELESTEIAATVQEFLTAAEACRAEVEVVEVPGGHHGFETVDHTEQARQAVAHAVRAVLRHLNG